jgi:hypothetical protein
LEDLAFAGIQEFARQWVLVNRETAYRPGNGQHQFLLNIGGSSGHSSLWRAEINEGTTKEDGTGGKDWDVVTERQVLDLREPSIAPADGSDKAREQETRLLKVYDDLAAKAKGGEVVKNRLKQASKMNGNVFGVVYRRLVDSGQLVERAEGTVIHVLRPSGS